MLDAGEHVAELCVRFLCIRDRIGRDVGHAQPPRERDDPLAALRVVIREMVLEFEIVAFAEMLAHLRDRRLRRKRAARERDQTIGATGEVVYPQTRIALGAAHLCDRDQFAEIRIAAGVLDQQHHPAGVFVGTLAADDRRDLVRAGGARESDRAVEAVAIGQGDRRKFQLGGARDQFFGMRGAFQKGEVRPGMQFGIAAHSIGAR